MYTITKEEHEQILNALSELKYKEASPFFVFFDKKFKEAKETEKEKDKK